jgi:2-polyprenyl-3-methyl-5-hydroxy-6-metoxy-1,4-benzoquinol methylase
MIGPYSTNQMDDFYTAFNAGEFKASGVMNLAQHLYVTERIRPGDRVVDVCCGRGLALPLLCRYAPQAGDYIGLDISSTNLADATAQAARAAARWESSFPVQLLETDVSQPWPDETANADVIIYTAALEHLPQPAGAASLAHAASALAEDGMLYLSTPLTPGPAPKLLQYGVHVYEWDPDELRTVLAECGLEVVDEIGLLPPEPVTALAALRGRFGDGAADWYTRLRDIVPESLLATVVAAALPEHAAEAMFVCGRRR